MNVTLIQADLIWENPAKNRALFYDKINAVTQTDLIVLPEMFTTGFTMNTDLAESMDGETVQWMKEVAGQKNCAITGTIIIEEGGKFYNRLVFVTPAGEVFHYNKRHLFSLAGEDKIFTAGTEKSIIDYRGWKICLLVCYDLRFPVFSRNTEDYDLLVYVANWPGKRIYAWDSLLKARAIENMCYTIGVNRVGEDGNNASYPGHSQVLDCLGKYCLRPLENEKTVTLKLDKNRQYTVRKKLGFLNDRDAFILKD